MQAEFAMMMNPKELISEGGESLLQAGNGNEDSNPLNLFADLMVMSRRLMVMPEAQQLIVDCGGNHDVPEAMGDVSAIIKTTSLFERLVRAPEESYYRKLTLSQEDAAAKLSAVPPVAPNGVVLSGSRDATGPGVPEKKLQPPDMRLEGLASSYSQRSASAQEGQVPLLPVLHPTACNRRSKIVE